MKVLCVDIEDAYYKNLTLNKWYFVSDISINLNLYGIVCDDGNRSYYSAERFKTIEEMREDKLEKLGI